MGKDTNQKQQQTLLTQITRGDLFSTACPSREILNHLTSRWGVLVILALQNGTHRFTELRKIITGVSERMLAQTLQNLEGDGFINRVSLPVVPPHVEYSLTPMGEEVAILIAALTEWIELNTIKVHELKTS